MSRAWDSFIFASVKTPRQYPAHLALIAAQVSFGLFPVFGTLIFRPGGLTPLGVAVWRLGAGAVVLLVLAVAFHGRRVIPARSDLGRFALAAWLGVGLNQAFFLEGLARSTPINATLVMCLIPVFTFGIAAVVRQEPFSGRRLAGVLIALAGLLPLLFEHGLHLGRYGLGNLLMTGNALCYSAYLVVAKPLAPRYPPLVVIAWAYVLSLPLVPYFAWGGERLLPATGNAGAWWALAYIVAFPTVIAYLLNMFALGRVRASTAAVYVYAQPLVAVFASRLVFGESISGAMVLAAAGLFVGVWMVTRQMSHSAPV